jgi:hypothetical protein
MNFAEFLSDYPIKECIDNFRLVKTLERSGYQCMGDLPITDNELLSINGIGVNHLDIIFAGYGIAACEFHNIQY